MKVTGLDNREHSWRFEDRVVYKDDRIKRSELHMRCRNILNILYPLDRIYEEVSLPGTGKLSLDFYVHARGLAIECHGEQHYKYVPHFHGSPMGFLDSRKRDMNKREWCEINGILLRELKYDRTDDEWTTTIEQD